MEKRQQPLISVIILNYETPELTSACLKSVLRSKYKNLEIVVLDNASRIGNFSSLKEQIDDRRVRLIRSSFNRGFAGGCNLALKYCKGKYLMLLNSDTEVSSNWAEILVRFMEANTNVGACQPKLLSLKDKRYFEHAGAAGGLMDIFDYPFTRGRIFHTIEKDKGQYDIPIEIAWATGAAMFLRRSIIKKIGFFDPLFFAYGEEADLCFRLYRCGWKVMSMPQSIVYHWGAATSSRNILKKLHWNHRNGWILLLKNYPLKTLVWVLPIRLVLETANIFYYLLTGKPQYVLSVFWAWASLIKNLSAILKSRQKDARIVKKYSSNYRPPPIYKGMIVWDYFVKGKKTYRQLLETSQ